MNVLDFAPYISLAISIITLGTLIKNNLTSGEKELVAKSVKTENKLVEYDRRIQALESELKHLPDRDTTHRLEISLMEIAGRLNTLDERLKPIAATSGRLQEFLLEQAKP